MDTEGETGQEREHIEPSWEARMDVMEQAEALRGKFFVSVGSREEELGRRGEHRDGEVITGDTRVLILRAPIQEGDTKYFVVITRDGPATIKYDPKVGDEMPGAVKWLLEANGVKDPQTVYSEQRKKHNLTLPDIIDKSADRKELFGSQYTDNTNFPRGYFELKGVRQVNFGILEHNKDTGLDPRDPATSYMTCGWTSYSLSPLKNKDWLKTAMEESFKLVSPPPQLSSSDLSSSPQ